MPASKGCCNLQRFLNSITPIVPSKTLSLACEHNEANLQWKLSDDKERIEYFLLKDLWNCYEEWSAFGVETRVTLKSGETVKQYYIPYLSALQVYVAARSSRNRRDADGVVEVDSESASDDSRSSELSRSLSKHSSNTWDSISEDLSPDQGGSWSYRDRFGDIYLEYFETCSLNWRMPLTNKMNELLESHPELNSLTSLDVSPASWMAVAWYPIYHIPNINNRDLSACFLTYHTLSSTFADNHAELSDKLLLAPFGIAIYKMQGDLWIKSGTTEYMKFVDLQRAASSWLKQLNVYHHDSSFFACRSSR